MSATEHELRNLTGIIYKITNRSNNKSYIGQSSVSFYSRYPYGKWYKYSNSYLSRSIKKYGLENFEITILDRSENPEKLNFLEHFYIKYFRSRSKKYGYNMKDGGGNVKQSIKTKNKISKTHSKTTYSFKDPEGKIHTFTWGLTRFCRIHGLNKGHMVKLHNKKVRRHKYWTRPELILIERKFISPTGKLHEVTEGGLRKFCRENDLNHSCMSKVDRGVHTHHLGWTKYVNKS